MWLNKRVFSLSICAFSGEINPSDLLILNGLHHFRAPGEGCAIFAVARPNQPGPPALADRVRGVTVAALADASRDIRPTPKEDRRRVVKEFISRNHCKVKDIQEAAGVDEADYYKWFTGKVPDHYSTCIASERVLRYGLPRRQAPKTKEG